MRQKNEWIMTYGQFAKELEKAGLTLKAFADLIKMNRNSISNYARKGDVPEHLSIIAALLNEMNKHNIDFKQVFERIDIEPKKPRGNARAGHFGGHKQAEFTF